MEIKKIKICLSILLLAPLVGMAIDSYKRYIQRRDLQEFINLCDELIAIEKAKREYEKKEAEK